MKHFSTVALALCIVVNSQASMKEWSNHKGTWLVLHPLTTATGISAALLAKEYFEFRRCLKSDSPDDAIWKDRFMCVPPENLYYGQNVIAIPAGLLLGGSIFSAFLDLIETPSSVLSPDQVNTFFIGTIVRAATCAGAIYFAANKAARKINEKALQVLVQNKEEQKAQRVTEWQVAQRRRESAAALALAQQRATQLQERPPVQHAIIPLLDPNPTSPLNELQHAGSRTN